MRWVDTTYRLVPESGVEIVAGRTVASESPAWLRLEPIEQLAPHKWVGLRYSSSFFDEPVRPLIRFVTTDGTTITLPMNGALFGSAEWIGRIPDHTVSVSISPTSRLGAFAFRIDKIYPVRYAALLARALKRYDWLYWAIRSRLLNSRREAWQALSFAACGSTTSAYAAWRGRLERPFDPNGLDYARSDWNDGPAFRLLIDLTRGGDLDRIGATIASLQAQIYSRWQLHAVADSRATTSVTESFRDHARGDARLSDDILTADLDGPSIGAIAAHDFVAAIRPGDCMPSHALAIMAETVARRPELDVVYADEDRMAPDGHRHSPIFKPDWSPAFEDGTHYVGRAVFFRGRLLTAKKIRGLLDDDRQVIRQIFRETTPLGIGHIRRLLFSRIIPADREHARRAAATARTAPPEPTQWPDVTVVIPTRDHAGLLEACVRGLRTNTDYPSLDVVIVDNGSTEPEATRLLNTLAAAPRTTVLRRPGRFNFSALSNDGARATTAGVLLFLNNDVAMIEPSWLKAMVRWAIKPEIGAVGAKLLFPDGRIQHAGVVVGFGGIAGHIYRRSHNDGRGYLDELAVPREVSAVTGACMMIERSKFDAVGGFDAENLPVDLNDIDLCLRIAEKGWTNLWTPEATLIHHQSATRGIDPDPYRLYRKERDYFVSRWADVMRDDPYFHPALSLYAHDVELA
jgi:GT2 family glycosyltransferase